MTVSLDDGEGAVSAPCRPLPLVAALACGAIRTGCLLAGCNGDRECSPRWRLVGHWQIGLTNQAKIQTIARSGAILRAFKCADEQGKHLK